LAAPPVADGDEPSAFARTIMRRSALGKIPPVEPLIDGIMSRRSTAVLVGQTGAGKTFVALSWACSVGTGHPWLARTVHRAPSLYVVGEGAHGLDARVSAWESIWQTDVSDDDVVFSARPASLSDRSTWSEMAAQAVDMGAGLIVLDTYSSLAWDLDETKDAPTVMRRLSDLAGDTGATALLVHHPGWADSGRARGGSQIEANADEVLILHGGPSSPLVELERKKVKEGAAGERQWLRRRPYAESVIIEAVRDSEVAADEGDRVERIIRDVFGGEIVSRTQVRDALVDRLSVSRTTAYEYLGRLIRGGVLARAGGTDRSPMWMVNR
jgi:AAA domain